MVPQWAGRSAYRRVGKSADSWVVEKAVPRVAHWVRLSAASSADEMAAE